MLSQSLLLSFRSAPNDSATFLKAIFNSPQYFRNIEEMEWAIECIRSLGKAVAATISIGPRGDAVGVPAGNDNDVAQRRAWRQCVIVIMTKKNVLKINQRESERLKSPLIWCHWCLKRFHKIN